MNRLTLTKADVKLVLELISHFDVGLMATGAYRHKLYGKVMKLQEKLKLSMATEKQLARERFEQQ